MKKFIFPFAFLLGMAMAFRGQAQCSCFSLTTDISNGGDCCPELIVQMNNPNCANLNYNTLTLNLYAPASTIITGFSASPMFTAVQNGNQIVFTASYNMAVVNGPQSVGTVCFASSDFFALCTATLDGPVADPFPCTFNLAQEIPCTPPDPYGAWAQVCGDTARNEPTRVKAYGGFVYVAGTRTINGLRHATFTKYDGASGAQVWARTLNDASIIHDFVRTVEDDGFMVVGATEPFQTSGGQQDNQSLLLRIFDNGTLTLNRRYQQNGREQFQRIIRQFNALDQNFPYYIVGTKNPTATPSASDIVTVFNTNSAGATGFYREYNYLTEEGEFHRGLYGLSNGNIVLTGNNTFVNDGMILEIHGSTGAVVKANTYPAGLDIYDFIVSNNGYAIIGADFGQSKAFIADLDQNYNVLQALHVNSMLDFREIGRDINGRLYALGTWKGPSKRNVMYRFIDNPGSGLVLDYARYLEEDNDESYLQAVFGHYGGQSYFLCRRSDQSRSPPPGFGGYDQMVGCFDLELVELPPNGTFRHGVLYLSACRHYSANCTDRHAACAHDGQRRGAQLWLPAVLCSTRHLYRQFRMAARRRLFCRTIHRSGHRHWPVYIQLGHRLQRFGGVHDSQSRP